MSAAELDVQLRALAADIEFPEAPELAAAVRAEVERPRRSRRRWLAAALALLVVVLAGALAVPSARTAIERWLGIGGVRFEFVDKLPQRRVVGTPGLGSTISLQDAQARTPFRIVVPPDDLGPYTLYIHSPPRGGVVSFVYGGTKDSARMILSELPGDYRPYIQKTISSTNVVTETEVDGRPALWLEGAHYVEFADAIGHFGFEPARLAGRVLLWERRGVTFRLEGALTLDQARKIAETVT
jgi:hypothetical protein